MTISTSQIVEPVIVEPFYRCICCGNLVLAGSPPRYPWVCDINDGGCGRVTEPSDNHEWTVFEITLQRYDPPVGRWEFAGYP